MEIDVFLCYRRAGAQTAKLFKRYLTSTQFPAKVWYSDDEIYGNYKNDIPVLIGSSQCAVLFVDADFTKGFVENQSDFECITAHEIVAIEKKLQTDADYRIFVVALDCKGFSLDDQKALAYIFKHAGIYTEQSVMHFSQCNLNEFKTAKDDEYVLFEKLVKELLSNSFFMEHPQQGNFSFGHKSTMADIAVWDTEKGIAPANITFELASTEVPLYQKISKMRCSVLDEVQNNTMISLNQLDVSLSDNDEQMHVVVCYQPIEYRLFHKTLKIWNTAGLNLNQKLHLYTLEKGPYEIPNAMGLAFMVITADHKLIFTKRSAKRSIRPNEYDCSIVEGLKIEVDSLKYGKYDVFDEKYVELEIRRAYREEICANDDHIQIKINGVVLDKEYGQWNIVGTIFSEEPAEALLRNHAVRNDTFEYIYMEAVSVRDATGNLTLEYLKALMPQLIQYKMWSMAYAVLYGALRNLGFSDDDIATIT